jgi:hypothetical protein
MDFGYYILNIYVPERDGPAASLYARYLEQVDAAAGSTPSGRPSTTSTSLAV